MHFSRVDQRALSGIRFSKAMEVGPVRGTSIMGAQLKVCQLRVLFDYSHKGRSPF